MCRAPVSRFDFSVRLAEKLGLKKDLIHPIKTAELNQKAKRPLNSSLVSDKMKSETQYRMIELDRALELFASQSEEDSKE